jgi:hypothetical protein
MKIFAPVGIRVRVLAYLVSACVIAVVLYELRAAAIAHEVQRAYIFVEAIQVENRPKELELIVHIYAKTGGEVILPTAIMNAAVVAHDYVFDKSEIDRMFAQADWSGSGWVSGMGNNLNPGEQFQFSKSYTPSDLEELKQVQAGTKPLYVLTRASFRDRWGVIAWKHSCSEVSARDNFVHREKCSFGND